MEDKQIIDLYFSRDEKALTLTREKYDAYLKKIISNILDSREDVEEQLETVYLETWNLIPPNRPESLLAFVSSIARKRAIDAYRRNRSNRHHSAAYDVCIDELSETLSAGSNPFDDYEMKRLGECLNSFLGGLEPEKRMIFMGRYYFGESIEEIAIKTHSSEGRIKTVLFRLREKLKGFLEKEGFNV